MTEPPPRNTFCSNVSQWEIFDAYQEDYQLNVFIENYEKGGLYTFLTVFRENLKKMKRRKLKPINSKQNQIKDQQQSF